MFEQCKREYSRMLQRLDQVIRNKWPETLQGDGEIWRWLDEQHPELRTKCRHLTKRLNEAWQNGMLAEFKQLVTEWGRVQLDIFRGYAGYLKQRGETV